eukprot:gb/GECH01010383.1/.p1 GENE.gb/GECH01010383.1/~~gb/GECH01010383.1/.p1  ORF type:complete len:2328 (+),score=375.31 gb/GECH01010383.1/:1-6984(+)
MAQSKENEHLDNKSQTAPEKPSIDNTNNQNRVYHPPLWSAKPSKPVTLQIIKEGVIVDQIDISDKPFYIVGRLENSVDIPMLHPSVSRAHAVLQHRNNGYLYIYDLNSTHGTFWNRRRIKPHTHVPVRSGDSISFGASSRFITLEGKGMSAPPSQEDETLRRNVPKKQKSVKKNENTHKINNNNNSDKKPERDEEQNEEEEEPVEFESDTISSDQASEEEEESTQETPTQVATSQAKQLQETTAQETLVQETNLQDTNSQERQVQENIAQETPIQYTPVEENSVQEEQFEEEEIYDKSYCDIQNRGDFYNSRPFVEEFNLFDHLAIYLKGVLEIFNMQMNLKENQFQSFDEIKSKTWCEKRIKLRSNPLPYRQMKYIEVNATDAKYLEEESSQLFQNMDQALNIFCTNLPEKQFQVSRERHYISYHLSKICENQNQDSFNSYDFRNMVSCIFVFVRYLCVFERNSFQGSEAETAFLEDLKTWSSRLVSLMLRYGTLEDRIFLLQQVITTKASNEWASHFIQIPPVRDDHMAYLFVSSLTEFLRCVRESNWDDFAQSFGDIHKTLYSDTSPQFYTTFIQEEDIMCGWNQFPVDTFAEFCLQCCAEYGSSQGFQMLRNVIEILENTSGNDTVKTRWPSYDKIASSTMLAISEAVFSLRVQYLECSDAFDKLFVFAFGTAWQINQEESLRFIEFDFTRLSPSAAARLFMFLFFQGDIERLAYDVPKDSNIWKDSVTHDMRSSFWRIIEKRPDTITLISRIAAEHSEYIGSAVLVEFTRVLIRCSHGPGPRDTVLEALTELLDRSPQLISVLFQEFCKVQEVESYILLSQNLFQLISIEKWPLTVEDIELMESLLDYQEKPQKHKLFRSILKRIDWDQVDPQLQVYLSVTMVKVISKKARTFKYNPFRFKSSFRDFEEFCSGIMLKMNYHYPSGQPVCEPQDLEELHDIAKPFNKGRTYKAIIPYLVFEITTIGHSLSEFKQIGDSVINLLAKKSRYSHLCKCLTDILPSLIHESQREKSLLSYHSFLRVILDNNPDAERENAIRELYSAVVHMISNNPLKEQISHFWVDNLFNFPKWTKSPLVFEFLEEICKSLLCSNVDISAVLEEFIDKCDILGKKIFNNQKSFSFSSKIDVNTIPTVEFFYHYAKALKNRVYRLESMDKILRYQMSNNRDNKTVKKLKLDIYKLKDLKRCIKIALQVKPDDSLFIFYIQIIFSLIFERSTVYDIQAGHILLGETTSRDLLKPLRKKVLEAHKAHSESDNSKAGFYITAYNCLKDFPPAIEDGPESQRFYILSEHLPTQSLENCGYLWKDLVYQETESCQSNGNEICESPASNHSLRESVQIHEQIIQNPPIYTPFEDYGINSMSYHILPLTKLDFSSMKIAAQEHNTKATKKRDAVRAIQEAIPHLFKQIREKETFTIKQNDLPPRNETIEYPDWKMDDEKSHVIKSYLNDLNMIKEEILFEPTFVDIAERLFATGEWCLSKDHNQESQQDGQIFIEHVISTYDWILDSFPPTKQVFITLLDSLVQSFILNEFQIASFINYLSSLSGRTALFASLFEPNRFANVFHELYRKILEDIELSKGSSAALPLLERFKIHSWLESGPSFEDRVFLLKTCLTAIRRITVQCFRQNDLKISLEFGNQDDKRILEVHSENALALLTNHWPELLPESMTQITEGLGECSIPPRFLTDFCYKINQEIPEQVAKESLKKIETALDNSYRNSVDQNTTFYGKRSMYLESLVALVEKLVYSIDPSNAWEEMSGLFAILILERDGRVPFQYEERNYAEHAYQKFFEIIKNVSSRYPPILQKAWNLYYFKVFLMANSQRVFSMFHTHMKNIEWDNMEYTPDILSEIIDVYANSPHNTNKTVGTTDFIVDTFGTSPVALQAPSSPELFHLAIFFAFGSKIPLNFISALQHKKWELHHDAYSDGLNFMDQFLVTGPVPLENWRSAFRLAANTSGVIPHNVFVLCNFVAHILNAGVQNADICGDTAALCKSPEGVQSILAPVITILDSLCQINTKDAANGFKELSFILFEEKLPSYLYWKILSRLASKTSNYFALGMLEGICTGYCSFYEEIMTPYQEPARLASISIDFAITEYFQKNLSSAEWDNVTRLMKLPYSQHEIFVNKSMESGNHLALYAFWKGQIRQNGPNLRILKEINRGVSNGKYIGVYIALFFDLFLETALMCIDKYVQETGDLMLQLLHILEEECVKEKLFSKTLLDSSRLGQEEQICAVMVGAAIAKNISKEGEVRVKPAQYVESVKSSIFTLAMSFAKHKKGIESAALESFIDNTIDIIKTQSSCITDIRKILTVFVQRVASNRGRIFHQFY